MCSCSPWQHGRQQHRRSVHRGGFAIDGAQDFDLAGRSVAGAGDVNGDGLADAIIGALYADPQGREKAGRAYVVFGKRNNRTVELSNFDLCAPVVPATLTIEPASVTGGASATGTVTLAAPALSGGAAVALRSLDPAVATVPASVTVPEGQTTAAFPVTTQPTATSTVVLLQATYQEVTRRAELTVLP